MWGPIVAVLVVFSVLTIGAAYLFGLRQEKRARALDVIGRVARDSADAQVKAVTRQRAEIAKKLKQVTDLAHQERKKDKLSMHEALQQAGIEAPVSRYWLFSGLFALFVGFILFLTSWPLLAKIFTFVAAFFGPPKLFLKWKTAQRQKLFMEEFADALDAMARLLQAGMPMTEAILMASREFSGPLKEEMIRVYDNQKIGVPVGEAALMMARRMPVTEVQMFATAVQIQSETGSSLSEVLGNLSAMIRSRFRLKRKVQALSSEAKSSAAIIGALPVLVTGGIYLARPEYIGVLFTTLKGNLILGGGVLWMMMGMLIMRQMINFKI